MTFLFSAALVPIFLALLPAAAEAAVTVSSTVSSSWSTGSTIALTFTNTGSNAVCAVNFTVTLPSGTIIASSWNMDAVSGSSTLYSLPSWISWVTIAANGGTHTSTGMTLSGTGTPTFAVVSSSDCASSSTTTTTTTTAAASTTTSTASDTTTTTTASGTTTTTASGTTTTTSSSSTNTLVVEPVYTTTDTCLSESSASGPITAVLNTAIAGGQFTFYGIGGRGACGLDMDTPTMSAAASGSLFNSSATWVPSCLSDGRYLLNDPICMNKCVKITYTCVGCSTAKTLTVPINNQCPECAEDHVDLSEAAFLWLEPQGGTVGVATDATITYIECA